MIDRNSVADCVFAAVDLVNEELPEDERLEKAADTRLTGPEGQLDSLALISLVQHVEQHLESRLGVTISLYDDKIVQKDDDPFARVDLLIDHVVRLAEARRAA